ncbi:arginase family protein [Streptomyces sp. NPDC096311]|uniref:arginase family protein n=1 Tax=Streptomyces sp. NPDC096311 TaxID=3366083 RepID=UPI00380E3DD7
MPDSTLRLIWPQWQGAGTWSVETFAPEFPLDVARRGYALGAKVLEAVLPPHDGPTATVPVTMSDEGLEERDGVEAKAVVVRQLHAALKIIEEQAPARITTLGGECSVSVAPFSELARRYGDDLAVIWTDSHPDIGTPVSEYKGYHAMALATLTGHGDPDIQDVLPATISPDKVALVGLHSWTEDDFPNVAEWGITSFSPDDLRTSTQPLLDWLASTGCSRVAIHFDVDAVDSNEVVLGLGIEPDGLTGTEVNRIVSDVKGTSDVVGLTIAEYLPRQLMHLLSIMDRFPLIP